MNNSDKVWRRKFSHSLSLSLSIYIYIYLYIYIYIYIYIYLFIYLYIYVGQNYTNDANTREARLAEGANCSEKRKWKRKFMESSKYILVVLSSLGPVPRHCPYQDGGANKNHHNIYKIRLIGTTQTAKKIPTTSKAKNIMYNLIQSKVEVLSSSTRSKQYNNSFLTDRFNNCLNVVENCGGSMVDYEDTEEEMASLSKLRPMIKWKLPRSLLKQSTWCCIHNVLRQAQVWKDGRGYR